MYLKNSLDISQNKFHMKQPKLTFFFFFYKNMLDLEITKVQCLINVSKFRFSKSIISYQCPINDHQIMKN